MNQRYSRNNIKVTLQKEKDQRDREKEEKEVQQPVQTRYELQEDGDTSQEMSVPVEESEASHFKDTQ